MANRSFIQRTINKSAAWVPLAVEPLQREHLDFWHTYIQPFISLLGPSQRVDHDWNWYTITSIARSLITVRQQPAAYALIHYHPTYNTKIVCGIIQLVRKYIYLPDRAQPEPTRPAGFLWKCATAPALSLSPYFSDADMPKRLAQLCIDVAVTVSEQDGYQGRICLHADPDSAPPQMPHDILLDFYSNPPLNMSQLDPSIPIPRLRGIVAPNDGRYFYFDDTNAFIFSLNFSDYRQAL